MSLDYQTGIKYSKDVCDKLEDLMTAEFPESIIRVETFSNNREQGYLFTLEQLRDNDEYISYSKLPCAWVFANRISDELSIIMSRRDHIVGNNMYDDYAYQLEIQVTSPTEAAKMIKNHFVL